MAPVRPAAAAPMIAPAAFLRSDLRVSVLFSVEDSLASCLDETDCLRTFSMRHLTRLVFLQDTHMRYSTQVFPHAANHTPTAMFPQSCVRWAAGQFQRKRVLVVCNQYANIIRSRQMNPRGEPHHRKVACIVALRATSPFCPVFNRSVKLTFLLLSGTCVPLAAIVG